MLVIELFFAFFIAFCLSVVFVSVFGWQPPARNDRDFPTALGFFFSLLFVLTWAGGLWIAPIGPDLWGAHWASFLLAGLIGALIIAAAVPPGRVHSAPAGDIAASAPAGKRDASSYSLFFWVLLGLLSVAIALHYLLTS